MPDADKAEAEVARGFRVVAGQNAQAAGGNGQRFVEAELRGKIRHRIFVQSRRVLMAPRLRVVQIIVEIAQHVADAVGKAAVPADARAARIPTPRAARPRRCATGSASRAARAAETSPAPPGSSTTRGCGTACSSPRSVRSIPRLSKVFSSCVKRSLIASRSPANLAQA